MSDTLTKLQEHLSTNQRPAPRIKCKDGESLSVQAGKYTYCMPRQDEGPWTEVEIGYPTVELPTIQEYQETPGTLQTVWGYVPIGLVVAFIDEHGGIAD